MFDKMKLKLKKVMKNEEGMTLIELLAVLVIIAIVALIAVPAIGNIINNSKDKAILADASNIIAGAKIAVQDGACTEAKTDTSVTCSETNLKDGYVENVKGSGFSATRGTDGAWTVTYPELANIKNDKFKPYESNATSKTTVTEKKINDVLGKTNTKATD